MKIITKLLAFFFIVCQVLPTLSAQEKIETDSMIDLSSIVVKAQNYKDSIVLRWTPDNANDWLLGNHYGYSISRTEMDEKFADDLDFVVLDTIAVSPLEEWKQYAISNPNKNYVAAAMQCVHGDPVADKEAQGLPNFILKQDMLTNRFGFTLFSCDLSVEAANRSALRYVDTDLEAGKRYYYRIQLRAPKAKSNCNPGYAAMHMDSVYFPKPLVLSTIEEESRIVLSWNREQATSDYTAYNIERSLDGQKFTRLNELPYIHAIDEEENFYTPYISYRDSLPGNYQPHYYRVAGITPFGDQGPWSEVISAQGVDRTPPMQPRPGEVEYTEDGNLVVSWDYPDPGESLLGVNLLYSYDLEKPFYLLNQEYMKEGAQTFIHKKPNPYLSHYYKIEAVDTAGNIALSIPFKGYIVDTIPPAQPTGLRAIADTSGYVYLSWDPNPELDVIGYKIFYANDKDHEFGLKTGHAIEATDYLDTISLNTFTEEAYYKIMAVDYSYNYSRHSEIIELKRPDIIPPSAPLFKFYEVREQSIYLQWARSNSDDVMTHLLYRRAEGTDWKKVKEFTDETFEFEDTAISPNTEYDYKIQAIDDAGLYSKVLKTIRLKSRQAVVPPVSNLTAVFDDETQSVKLNWNFDAVLDAPYSFVIYKARGEEGYNRLRVNEDKSLSSLDYDVNTGDSYKYAIKVFCRDGRKSAFSDIRTLVIN